MQILPKYRPQTTSHGFVLCVFAFFMALIPMLAEGHKTPTVSQESFKESLFSLSLSAGLALSDDKDIPHGFGITAQLNYRTMMRIGVSAWAEYARHAPYDRLRAAIGIHYVIDEVVIIPFLQAGVGVDLRFGPSPLAWTFDLHLGIGFDVPLGANFHIGPILYISLPMDPTLFPFSKAFHLRLTLLW